MGDYQVIKPPPGFVLETVQPPPGFVLEEKEEEELLQTPVPSPNIELAPRQEGAWTVPQYTGEGLDVAREKNKELFESISGVVGDVTGAVSDWIKRTPPGKASGLGGLAVKGATDRLQPRIEEELGGVHVGLTQEKERQLFPGAGGTYSIGGGKITSGLEDLGANVKQFANQTIVPPLEAAMALGGGALGFPTSLGATFLNKLGGATWDEALKFGEEFSTELFAEWMPKTERGQKLTEAAFKPFEFVFQKPEEFLVKKFGGGDPETEAKIRLAWRSAILAAPLAKAKLKGIKFDFTKPFQEAFKEISKEMGVVKPRVTPEMATKYFHAGIPLDEALKDVLDPTGSLWAETKSLWNDFRSPNRVLGTVEAGKRIWGLARDSSLEKLSWLHKEALSYKEATKGIKKGGDLESGVFKTLDAKTPMVEIIKGGLESAKEFGITEAEFAAIQKNITGSTRLRKFYVERMPAMLRKYGLTLVDDTMEGRLWKLTTDGKKPTKLKDPKTGKMRVLTENETLLADLYSRRITDYIPHMFDNKTLLGFIKKERETLAAKMTELEKQGISVDSPAYIKLIQEQAKLRGTEERILKGPATQPLLFDALPGSLRFKYFNPRRGQRGYNTSSMAAYESYVSGIAKKIFDEPAVKQMAMHFQDLPIDMKNYAARYIRDFGGYNRPSPWATNLRSMQWMLKLGINPRSALVNFTQRMNTIGEHGPMAAGRGFKNAILNKDGIREIYEKTGLRETAHQTFIGEEQKFPLNVMEKARRAAGFLFEAVEDGNRYHEFSTGYFEALRKGKSKPMAIEAGIKAVGTSQFFYGKMDMPMIMRTTRGTSERAIAPMTGLATQFWSFPVKQVELLSHWWKTNKPALLRWVILSEGARYGLDEIFGVDLSNSLGFGAEWGDVLEALDAVAEGDLTKARHKAKRGLRGGGIAPYGFGPAIQMFAEGFEAAKGERDPGDVAYKQLVPTVIQRGISTGKALAEGPSEEGKYPVRNARGDLMYEESLLQLGARMFVARPSVEKESQDYIRDKVTDRRLKNEVIRDFADAVVAGDQERVSKLLEKYKIFPRNLKQSIMAAVLRKNMTAKDRAMLDKGIADLIFEEVYINK